jgi:hypothetical protein
VAVAEVVFKMVATVFKDIAMLIFNLPPCVSTFSHLNNIVIGEGQIGNPAVFVRDFVFSSFLISRRR